MTGVTGIIRPDMPPPPRPIGHSPKRIRREDTAADQVAIGVLVSLQQLAEDKSAEEQALLSEAYLRRGQYVYAITHGVRVPAGDPNFSSVQGVLADAYLKTRQLERAIIHARLVPVGDVRYGLSQEILALWHLKRSEYGQAKEYAARVSSIEPALYRGAQAIIEECKRNSRG